MSILNKLEIDVMIASEIGESALLASKYKLPAIIVHQNLAADAEMARGRVQGNYKIITPIDWPKGENFGNTKLRGLSLDALDVDGFEILLTPDKPVVDTRNEAKAITELLRNQLGALVEVRFVLGSLTRGEESVKSLSEGLLGVPTPAYVRNDIHLKSQVGKSNPEVHNKNIELIKEKVSVPVKIAGNINDMKTIAACKSAARFGVSLTQAKNIVKEFNNQPSKVTNLFA